ncbi:MAG: hypothetical protein E7626_04700 [Ruminococcaceae bacterium]|nr:hypothetical protein [Oscillospiraceae bacterium]
MKASTAILLAFLLAFFLFSCKNSQNEAPSLPAVTSPEENVPENGEKMFFDENGNLQKIIRYENGKILSIREYSPEGVYLRYTEYTDYGHFTEEKQDGDVTSKISFFDKNSLLTEVISYFYHDNGVISREMAYASDGSLKGVWYFDVTGVNNETDFYRLENGKYVFDEKAKYFCTEDGAPEKTLFYTENQLLTSEIRYNAAGDIEKVVYYGSDGEISSYTIFVYSESGLLTGESSYSGLDVITSQLLYNENGEKLSFTSYFESGLPALIYNYSGGILSEILRCDDSGNVTCTEFFDENSTRTGVTFYNSDGSFLICDASYNPISGTKYTTDLYGGYTKTVYKDSEICEETVSRDGINIDSIRTFDELGFVSQEILYTGGRFDVKINYERDTQGEVLSYTEYSLNGTTLTYSPDGNIISGTKYVYSKGTLYKVVEYENSVVSKETMYSSGAIVLISLYDENGEISKESFYSAAGKLSRVREYDENGVLRKDTLYNERGKVSSVTKYDEKGNKI